MAHSVVDDVLNDIEVAYCMDSHSSVVSLMNRIAFNNRLCNCAYQVEMDRVSSKLEGLADICELYVHYSADTCLIARCVQHDVGTIFVFGRCLGVASVLNISGQQTNFSTHADCISAECLSCSVMLVN